MAMLTKMSTLVNVSMIKCMARAPTSGQAGVRMMENGRLVIIFVRALASTLTDIITSEDRRTTKIMARAPTRTPTKDAYECIYIEEWKYDKSVGRFILNTPTVVSTPEDGSPAANMRGGPSFARTPMEVL
jgi:hypothetical protein